MLYIGIDEAGLGPRLGPLVVTATCFRMPQSEDLWEALQDAVSQDPARSRSRTIVCDSKKLYTSRTKELKPLEESALTFCGSLSDGACPRQLGELLQLVGEDWERLSAYPWYRRLGPAGTPIATFASVVERRAARLAESLSAAGAELLGIRTICCDVGRFNQGIEHFQNKATFHTRTVCHLIEQALAWAGPGERVRLDCDRLGGRKRYASHLYDQFPQMGLETLCQEDDLSAYRLSDPRSDRHLTIQFLTRGDQRSFAVAVSSIISKYLRERLMAHLNDFFVGFQPTLRPTAGYPQDANRFLEETAEIRAEQGIEDQILVRQR